MSRQLHTESGKLIADETGVVSETRSDSIPQYRGDLKDVSQDHLSFDFGRGCGV